MRTKVKGKWVWAAPKEFIVAVFFLVELFTRGVEGQGLRRIKSSSEFARLVEVKFGGIGRKGSEGEGFDGQSSVVLGSGFCSVCASGLIPAEKQAKTRESKEHEAQWKTIEEGGSTNSGSTDGGTRALHGVRR